MNDIINRIIDIEKKAEAVVHEAEKEKNNIDNIVKAEVERLKSEIEKKAADKCAYIKTLEDNDAVEHLEETQKNTEATKQSLIEIYNQKHTEWVENIVAEIINL